MAKFHFVFTDSKENFLIDKDCLDQIKNDKVDITYSYHSNNQTSLPEVFNSELDIVRNDKTYDYVIFLHGDVKLDVLSLINRILEVGNKYDVIGLAGTKKIKFSNSPLNWFTGSRQFPNERYGNVTMVNDSKNVTCYYNEFHHKDTKDTEVACIDGLCIIFTKRVIESDLKFDEDIGGYDLYDTDISLQSLLKYKFKLGVIIEPVLHTSVGKSILSQKFLDREKIFREKWKF